MIPKEIVHKLISVLVAAVAACAACTPEAVEVDGTAGAAGKESHAGTSSTGGSSVSSGDGGANSETGGTASAGTSAAGAPSGCAAPTSPRAGCAACLAQECPAEVAACQSSGCGCGDFGGYTGQMSCLLACIATSGAKIEQVDACAGGCGFQDLMHADRATHELFDCLVVPPMGPPACPGCL